MEQEWSDELLDGMRQQGDGPADAVIAALVQEQGLDEARKVLIGYVRNSQAIPDDLPPVVKSYLQSTGTVTDDELAKLKLGQDMFAEHGPLVLMCLACYSLPAAYAAAKGVEVLHRTAYLERRPTKRLFQTTQMVIDVMTPGGLAAGGKGIATAQKVRLMHAMVRHMIQNDQVQPWPADLGVPINQEDMAGTLMTFSWIVLDGLGKLNAHTSKEAQQSYIDAWCVVGRLMGVHDSLLPRDVLSAERLTKKIQARQIAPSEAGRLMTAALLEMLQRNMPSTALAGMPGAMIRHFLPAEVSDFLGVPDRMLDNLAFDVVTEITGHVDELIESSTMLEDAARHFGSTHLQTLIDVELGGRPDFEIPTVLRRRWILTPATEPTFFQKLWAWVGRSLRRLWMPGPQRLSP